MKGNNNMNKWKKTKKKYICNTLDAKGFPFWGEEEPIISPTLKGCLFLFKSTTCFFSCLLGDMSWCVYVLLEWCMCE